MRALELLQQPAVQRHLGAHHREPGLLAQLARQVAHHALQGLEDGAHRARGDGLEALLQRCRRCPRPPRRPSARAADTAESSVRGSAVGASSPRAASSSTALATARGSAPPGACGPRAGAPPRASASSPGARPRASPRPAASSSAMEHRPRRGWDGAAGQPGGGSRRRGAAARRRRLQAGGGLLRGRRLRHQLRPARPWGPAAPRRGPPRAPGRAAGTGPARAAACPPPDRGIGLMSLRSGASASSSLWAMALRSCSPRLAALPLRVCRWRARRVYTLPSASLSSPSRSRSSRSRVTF